MADQPTPTTATHDPIALFQLWYDEARASEINDSNAMALATVDSSGAPSLRMVLLKGHGPDGFVFYTNGESRKAQDLAVNAQVALLFHWKTLRRQIRIEGPVTPVDDAAADAYFASRARDSRLGAWASDQSRPLADRETFEARFEAAKQRFDGQDVPRPPHWGGWRVAPRRIEFWLDRQFRLHERTLYEPDDNGGWRTQMLFP